LFFLFRGRYGPLLRIAAGVAVIVFGLIDSASIALVIGGLLLAWGLVVGIGQLTGNRRNSPTVGGQRHDGFGRRR
jgi:hypothetical protein